MGISDLAAPARRVALADQREAVAGAKGLHPLHEQVAECQRLAAQFAHVGLEQQVDARLERREPEHRRRAAEETLDPRRSEEHTSELQSLMRISYAVFCLKKKKRKYINTHMHTLKPTYHETSSMIQV